MAGHPPAEPGGDPYSLEGNGPGTGLISRDAEGAGVRLRLHVAGEGPAVVLLHGFPDSWTTWSEQVGALVAEGFSVHLPALRGYGGSGRPSHRGAYEIRHLVADIVVLIRSLPEGRAILGGHDWGGIVAWALAQRHPELVERLVIVNAPHPALFARFIRRPAQLLRSWYAILFQLPWLPEKALAAGDFRLLRAMAAMGDPGGVDPERVEAVVEDLRQPGALRAALDYYRANRRRAAGARAPRMPVQPPTLLLWGERDPALHPRIPHLTAPYVADLTLRVFPRQGHWLHREAPDAVNREIVRFLRGR